MGRLRRVALRQVVALVLTDSGFEPHPAHHITQRHNTPSRSSAWFRAGHGGTLKSHVQIMPARPHTTKHQYLLS